MYYFHMYSPLTLLILNLYCIMLSYKCIYLCICLIFVYCIPCDLYILPSVQKNSHRPILHKLLCFIVIRSY
jgi:hypothetical protein